MKIGIANDHHGIELKKRIINYFERKGIEYENYGCNTKEDAQNIDYVDYAVKLCKGIQKNKIDLGILICGTGVGMSVVANKMKGIIAGKVNTPNEARLIREHNMANVMTLAEYTKNVEQIVGNFINAKPSTEERHHRRVKKIFALENKK